MSTVKSDNYLDGFGGTTATINGITPINIATANASDIGIGQTWRSVKDVRAANTTYQNETEKPIMVTIRGKCTSGNESLIVVSIDQTDWVLVGGIPSGYYYSFYTFIVPPGTYYRINGSTSIYDWAELRS